MNIPTESLAIRRAGRVAEGPCVRQATAGSVRPAGFRLWLGLFLLGMMISAFAVAATPDRFAASFVQTRTLPGFAQPLVGHGQMRFSAETGFHWEITAPYHYVFDMQGGQAREVLPDGTRRTLKADQTPWLQAVQRMFVGALSGNRERLQRYFTVVAQPLAQGRHVTLTPKPDSAMAKVIRRIEVTETAPGHPSHLVIDEVSGAHMDIRFTPLDAAAGSE
jgi:hypothetical protein